MKLMSVLSAIFLLLVFFASTVPQPLLKTVGGQRESSEVLVASGTTMFFNFTSDHLFVDDDGDWRSQGTEIKRIYVACDEQFVYILRVKPLTGSHMDEMYFDVGEGNGYPMDTMNATYMFASGGHHGLYKWNGTDFQLLIPLNSVGTNLWKSDDERVVHGISTSQYESEEYWELKVAWSVFGSPRTIKIINRIKYSGLDEAPDGTFIVIYQNQSQRFIASFYAKTSEFGSRLWEIRKQSIGYYSEGFNASLKLMNLGNSSLESLNVSINLPTGLFANLNETSWNIALEPNGTWNQQFKLSPEQLGQFNLTATISSSEFESTFSQTIPLNLFVIPKMSVTIHHSGQMKAGFPNKLNITIVNHERINAEVSVTTYGQYVEYWYFSPLSLELGSNSSVRITSEIAPLGIINPEDTHYNYSFLEMALEYENLPICSSGSFPFPNGPITITEPNVQIILQYPREVIVGETFYVNISAVNKENDEIMASFKVRASAWSVVLKQQYPSPVLILEDSSYKEQTALISPNSNITFSFKFKAMEEYPWGAGVILYLRHGSYGDDYGANIKVVSLSTKLWPTMQYALITVFFAAVVGLAFLLWKKKKHAFNSRKNQTRMK
jgi:hypothetical protein